MNILIIYATYSGGTQTASQFVANKLSALNHTVSLKQAHEIDPAELLNHDLIIFGSPSWLQDGKEGQPHTDFVQLMARLKDTSLENKKFAIYGLGDTTYAHFCGAVDHIKKFVEESKGINIIEPLRIDGFYFNTQVAENNISQWVEKLNKQLA